MHSLVLVNIGEYEAHNQRDLVDENLMIMGSPIGAGSLKFEDCVIEGFELDLIRLGNRKNCLTC